MCRSKGISYVVAALAAAMSSTIDLGVGKSSATAQTAGALSASLSSVDRTKAKKPLVVGASSLATIQLDASGAHAAIKVPQGSSTNLDFPTDFKARSIFFADVDKKAHGTSGAEYRNDLVVLGVDRGNPNKTLLLLYPGIPGQDIFGSKQKATIEDFRISTGALMVGDVITCDDTTKPSSQDVVIAGVAVDAFGNQTPQMIMIPYEPDSTGFTDEGDWMRIASAIEIDDVLPGDIDASLFNRTVTGFDEESTQDIWVRLNGSSEWVLLLRTGPRSFEKMPAVIGGLDD